MTWMNLHRHVAKGPLKSARERPKNHSTDPGAAPGAPGGPEQQTVDSNASVGLTSMSQRGAHMWTSPIIHPDLPKPGPEIKRLTAKNPTACNVIWVSISPRLQVLKTAATEQLPASV